MSPNAIAENVLGTMGTVCWAGQLIPQVWMNYRNKKTDGLSPLLMLMWGVSSAFLGVYAILQHLNIPLQVQAQIFGCLALVSWGQCLYYDSGYSRNKALLITLSTMAFVGGMEVMLVFVSRPAYEKGITAPVQLCGILSVVLIAGGLLPQYWEIYQRREVVGISFVFISIDTFGGLLNDLSLAFAEEFDGLAAASYTCVIIMDAVVIIAAIILNPRARKRRRLEGEAEVQTSGTVQNGVGDTEANITEERYPIVDPIPSITNSGTDTVINDTPRTDGNDGVLIPMKQVHNEPVVMMDGEHGKE